MVLGGSNVDDTVQKLIDIQYDLAKRVERLETLEFSKLGVGCWRCLDEDNNNFSSIVNNAPDYPHLSIWYRVKASSGTGLTNLLMRWNNISTATYEGAYIDISGAYGAPFYSISTYSGATSVVIGKAPLSNLGVFFASGVIFWPMVQNGYEVPVFGLNACIDLNAEAGSRFHVGLYGGFNTGYNTCPVTDIDFLLGAGGFHGGSLFQLYEVCEVCGWTGGGA